MESVAPVGAAVPGAPVAVYIPPATLCGDTFAGEHRMIVAKTSEDLVRVDGATVIERDAEGFRCRQALQYVHVIGDDRASLVNPEAVIPAGPGDASRRQQACVRVQDYVVGLVRQRAKDFALVL